MEYPKDDGYYAGNRTDIHELLKLQHGVKVLDVGCGYGGAGQLIKAKYKAEVHGIELNSRAAEKARQHYDTLIHANIEFDEWFFEAKYFDCTICSDVFETCLDQPGSLR